VQHLIDAYVPSKKKMTATLPAFGGQAGEQAGQWPVRLPLWWQQLAGFTTNNDIMPTNTS
jgi:hypothetical protein